MLTRIKGGRIIDPAQGRDELGDVWMRDGRVIAAPAQGASPDATHDATDLIVMAGAIDIHSHIAGPNVNTARLLLPEQHRRSTPRPAHTPLAERRLVDLRDRLRLCGDGLYDGRRAGRRAAPGAARPP